MIQDAELIDLSEYEYSGEGANGASYNHRSDPTTMVKLYNGNMDVSLVALELETARKVYDAGIPSPEPGAFVTDGKGRYGIRFKRLVGKVSISRAIGNDPSRVEEYARLFARMSRGLHATHVDTSLFPCVKDQYLSMLATNPSYDAEEKAKLRRLIEQTPDTDTALHGDLQFSNALIVGAQQYFIDLGEFAYGHPYFDLGMTLITGMYNDESFSRDVFHMTHQNAIDFFRYFVDEYFEGRLNLEEAEILLRPYAIIKSLLVERNARCRIEIFHNLIKTI